MVMVPNILRICLSTNRQYRRGAFPTEYSSSIFLLGFEIINNVND